MEKELTAAMVLHEHALSSETSGAIFEEDMLSKNAACSVEPFTMQNYNGVNTPIGSPFKIASLTELTSISQEAQVGISDDHDSAIISESNLLAIGSVQPPTSNPSTMIFLADDSVLNMSNLGTENISMAIEASEQPQEKPAVLEKMFFSIDQFQGLCRICANNAFKLIPLFHGEGHSLSLVEKIHRCLPIKILDNDDFPHQICDDCASKLHICDNLISTSIAGNNKLISMSVTWMKSKVLEDIKNDNENTNEEKEARNVVNPEQKDNKQLSIEHAQLENDRELQSIDFNVGFLSVPSTEIKEREWSCSDCSYKATRKSSLMLHRHQKHNAENNQVRQARKRETSPQEKSDASFMCTYCDKNFQSETRLKKHMHTHTRLAMQQRESVEVCTLCNEEFFSSKKLRMHTKNVHGINQERKYSCDKCDKSYRMPGSLDIHRATHSNETPFLCDICGKSFKHASNLRCHKRSHLGENLTHRHACDLCPKSFPSKFHLSEHKNVHLDITPYSCGVCEKKFHRRIQLRQHKVVHNNESSYDCPQCGACFNRRGNMTQHMKRHLKERKFICKVCKDSFQTLSEVVQHRRKHTAQELMDHLKEKGAYCCPQCQKPFSSSSDLEEHVKSHAEIKFQCEVCNKQLSNRRTLEYHIRSFHTGERPFSCQYCSESFLTRETCAVHERVHTGEKPYICSVCQMSFRCSSNLAQHASTHQDDRPWACDHCPKRFKRKGILRVHLRTHTGEKPFCCDICGRRFTQKNDMLKHQQTHKSAKPSFVCCNCNWAFHSRKELNKHRQAHHAVASAETSSTPMLNSVPPFPAHSQAFVISDDLCQFPITILEDGSNVIVHQIEEIGGQTHIVEVNPNEPCPQLVHFSDSLFQTVVPEPQVLQLPTSDPTNLIQFDDGTTVSVLSSTADSLLM